MDGSNGDFAELNKSFDELLIENDEEGPFVDNEAAAQSLIVPMKSDSAEDDDESDHDKEKTWTEDTIIHDQFPFVEEYGRYVDVQGCETPIDYFYFFVDDQLLDLIVMGKTDVDIRKRWRRTNTRPKIPSMNSDTLWAFVCVWELSDY